MATLVLSTVGAMYGGPIGRAVGAVVGLAIDQMIFAPKPRHGPRLGDLSVQTSSYGSQIPKMFGTMRAAGTVIWATDLVETKAKSGGGKGRPKTINYSYAANFAVALSARRVRAVRRAGRRRCRAGLSWARLCGVRRAAARGLRQSHSLAQLRDRG